MAKTKADLSRETALELSVIDAHDPALSSEDAAYIEGKYDRVLERWRDEGLVYWPNTDRTTQEIPDAVFDSLAKMLAGEVWRQFGFDAEPLIIKRGRQMTISECGEYELRAYLAKRTDNEPVTTESF